MNNIEESLQLIKTEAKTDLRYLSRIVDAIRPAKSSQVNQATETFRKMIEALQADPELRDSFSGYIAGVFARRRKVKLLTELGITSEGLFTDISQKVFHRLLPPLERDDDLFFTISKIFHKRKDYKWAQAVPAPLWAEFFRLAGFKPVFQLSCDHPAKEEVMNAISIISHRIAGIGLSPRMIDKLPALNRPESPFIMQNKELTDYLQKFRSDCLPAKDDADYRHLLVMLSQCEEYADAIRRGKYKFGANLSLTNLMLRLQQNIARMRTLLDLLHADPEAAPLEREAGLFVELVAAECVKNDLRASVSSNISLLAYQVTEFSGNTGSHYITDTSRAFLRLFGAALGGGFIVAFFVLFKAAISKLHLSEFMMAFLYSMNYAAGFILIYITHATLATKHPAMTAPRIAKALDDESGAAVKNLAPLIVRLIRSQFVAFLGNIAMAYFAAYFIGGFFFNLTGFALMNDEDALHLIDELHPTQSLSILHAAIAGVGLFLAGIISGFFDNQNLFHAIPRRIKKVQLLRKALKPRQLVRLSKYMELRLGGLMGNFALGVFLGSIAPLGDVVGLPLDIRHVTFSSGNFGIAMASLPYVPAHVVIISLLGILIIGFMNFMVSFGMALYVAVKSRRIRFKQTRVLFRLLAAHFFRYPFDFFFPTNRERTVPPVKQTAQRKKSTADYEGMH